MTDYKILLKALIFCKSGINWFEFSPIRFSWAMIHGIILIHLKMQNGLKQTVF